MPVSDQSAGKAGSPKREDSVLIADKTPQESSACSSWHARSRPCGARRDTRWRRAVQWALTVSSLALVVAAITTDIADLAFGRTMPYERWIRRAATLLLIFWLLPRLLERERHQSTSTREFRSASKSCTEETTNP